MAFLGDIGLSAAQTTHTAGIPVFRLQRPPTGMNVDIPALSGGIVQIGINGVIVGREYSIGNVATFWDLMPGNYVASVLWGNGTGSAWSVVVTPTMYTVTRIGGSGVTGHISVG